MSEVYSDRLKVCPVCSESGRLHYTVIPESRLIYKNEDDEEITEFLPQSRDYTCGNCDADFILTNWED